MVFWPKLKVPIHLQPGQLGTVLGNAVDELVNVDLGRHLRGKFGKFPRKKQNKFLHNEPRKIQRKIL